MKLTDIRKKKLLTSANQVYLAYTALDFFKSKKFHLALGDRSLYELCCESLTNKVYDQYLQINQVNYRLLLVPGENNTFKVQLSRPIGPIREPIVKKIGEYKEQEALDLLASQDIALEVLDLTKQPTVTNSVNKEYVIGGQGKVELYRTHLVTLHNIIEKIHEEEDISNLLVALATGSGKTFIQALWMFILSLSNNNGVFAIPGKLINQFTTDLRRLLPDDLVNKILVLPENEENHPVVDSIKAMAQPDGNKAIVIGSVENLLDNYYQELLDASSDQTFLSFDEQHLIMKQERRRVRLIELAQQKLSMFLTATPNKETYDLSGNKPVAIMSSGQKQQAGQGQFPCLLTHNAQSISDKNRWKDFRFWTSNFWNTALNGLLLRLTNSIQGEQSSAAVSLIEDLPFFYYRKEDENQVRWRLQIPAARKMLCIIDNNEDLVNFCYSLEHASHHRRDVYHDGNIINRLEIANFFGIPDAEEEIIHEDMRNKKTNYLTSLKADEKEIGEEIKEKRLDQQIRDNIFHNLIEYLLMDLTGLDEIEHNRLRKSDMSAFKQMVINKFSLRTADYYEQKLAKEIDAAGAHDLGIMLAELSQVMHRMIHGGFEESPKKNEKALADFIDNWPLYNALKRTILRKNNKLSKQFKAYTQSHLIMGIMTGMNEAETPVKDSQPFAGLIKNSYSLYDSNGAIVSYAKKRKHTSLEILDEQSQETLFTPRYLNISETVADNYAKLGFIGVYVSNKKTEGFSDRNLHTVINIAEHQLSPSNSPDTQIQGIGRNRGLDNTIIPAYIHSLGRNAKTMFDLEHLKSEDYYPALFEAQNTFNKESIRIVGSDVSKKIIAWIHANIASDETINPDRLKKQVLRYVAQALRDINNKNSHKIGISRAQLTQVVSYAMKGINEEIKRVNKPYTVSTFVTLLGHFLNFLSECYYALKRIPAAWKLFKFSWFRKNTTEHSQSLTKQRDDLYLKILSKTSFKNIIAKVSSALEFKNWLSRKVESIESHISKNLEAFVTKPVLDEFTRHQKRVVEPFLLKMVVDSKKEKAAKALNTFPHLISLLKANLETLTTIIEQNQERAEPIMLDLLKQIPGLEDLILEDIVNYPQSVKILLAQLRGDPVATLLNDLNVQDELVLKIGIYLKSNFINHLSAFVTYPTMIQIKGFLAKDETAQQFSRHCLIKLMNKELKFSPEALLSELKTYFKSPDLLSLDEEILALSKAFNVLHNKTTQQRPQYLDDSYVLRLSVLIQNQLLPVLVNNYPLESREKLLKEASDLTKIKKLIKEEGDQLLARMEYNKEELPGFILSKLCGTPLPSPLNIPQQIIASQELIIGQFQAVMEKSFFSLLFAKAQNMSSWSIKSKYLYDTAIVDLLRSDDFLNAISIMLPYNQWLDLKSKIKQDYSGTLSIARVLIDKAESGALSEVSPQELLTLFNKQFKTEFLQSDEAINQVSNSFDEVIKEILANPFNALDPTAKAQYAHLVSNQLLPILASFINDDAKKEQLLSMKRDEKTLIAFIAQNIEAFEFLIEEDESKMEGHVLALLNQLISKESPLTQEDIITPQAKATQSSEILMQELKRITLPVIMNGSVFCGFLKMAFNTEDFSLLMAHLNAPEQRNLLVDKMIATDLTSLDVESILALIKSSDSSLDNIATMEERMGSLSRFFQEKEQDGTALSKKKVDQFAGHLIAPVLFHKQMITIIDELLAFLDEGDLAVLFEAMNQPNPAEEAKQFMAFINTIKRRDTHSLINQFFVSPAGEEITNLEQLPVKRMIDHIQQLIEEVLDCHCYYHNQDRKGFEGRGTEPKIMNKISPKLGSITIQSDRTFLSSFSRKIFYIQGVNNGVASAGQVNADSNQHLVKILQRVNSHILRPLWWSTNVSNITHSFVKGCRNLVQAVVSGYFAVLNGLKAVFHVITGHRNFVGTKKHPDSQDYNDTAFEYSATLNQLDPLNKEQVSKKDCVLDVVTQLEEFVAKRPTRPGFFNRASDNFARDSTVENLGSFNGLV